MIIIRLAPRARGVVLDRSNMFDIPIRIHVLFSQFVFSRMRKSSNSLNSASIRDSFAMY